MTLDEIKEVVNEGKIDRSRLDAFTIGFLECALETSNDESREDGGDPLDLKYDLYDFDEPSLVLLVEECKRFQEENAVALESCYGKPGPYSYGVLCSESGAGRDFWMTRNCTGVSFDDGDYPNPQGKVLAEESLRYGNVDLYLHHDTVYAAGYELGLEKQVPAWLHEQFPKRLGGG